MTKKQKNAISPTRDEDYAQWYQQVVKEADLAENSSVRGSMVIKPWGYGIWENIQKILNDKIKETGHQNAYFPLFIPLSLFEKEAQHVKGFAKECAVVTHTRLELNEKNELIPVDKLEQPLVVRPTSEMIIGQTFAKWIESYRDLPLLINQWANIVRWEMRPRLFLRTTEFLWQEGHTVHATEKEAQKETLDILFLYKDFIQNFLAIPVIVGEKTASERFPGAVATYSLEAMMQDKKALQAGTSHFLGQNFAISCDIKFMNEKEQEEYGWMTSWGVTSRLIGGMIMTHSDDNGLVLPPRIAPAHMVILPIMHKEEHKEKILRFCYDLAHSLQKIDYQKAPLQVVVDAKEMRGGAKKWKWIKKGVPIILEIGMKDIEENQFFLLQRDKLSAEKHFLSREQMQTQVVQILEDMQTRIFEKALEFQQKNIVEILTKQQLFDFFLADDNVSKGFALCYLADVPEVEKILKEKLHASFRCFPFQEKQKEGKCLLTEKTCLQKVIVAKAY